MRGPKRTRVGSATGPYVAGFVFILALACSGSDREPPDARPNVLWVVWDTVRADHLSLYGHSRLTTPYLQEWARDARVFEDCWSTAPTTVPSHAAMFTGLLPSEHGANQGRALLDDAHTTIAELFQQSGYQTYLFSANPYISREGNFQQGFDVEEHPWDPEYREQALSIVRRKIPREDESSELPKSLEAGRIGPWSIKAAGELAQSGIVRWLEQRDPDRPFFAFLNYMESHRPLVPARRFRARVMAPDQVERSYRVDRSWNRMWSYTFGLHEYSAEELETMGATYDAALAELDSLFRDLLRALEQRVDLDRTVVILTSDHGEHLGEHHMLDHQYSLYEPLLRVPLIVRYPSHFAPGSETRPVVNLDLFPTLLELAQIEAPQGLRSRARSLLAPLSERPRLAEYLSPFTVAFESVQRVHDHWEPTRWNRTLRAIHAGGYKYIWASDGRHELYRYPEDRAERDNRIPDGGPLVASMRDLLDGFVSELKPAGPPRELPAITEGMRKRLEALGYLAPGEEGSPELEAAPADRG